MKATSKKKKRLTLTGKIKLSASSLFLTKNSAAKSIMKRGTDCRKKLICQVPSSLRNVLKSTIEYVSA